mmetsp:Transcript_22235/g.42440  ORF Transcript_22235/g.42440 Transcript_22235/m.42440 type:complete len:248 (-) Transcript_22235:96-839(-)
MEGWQKLLVAAGGAAGIAAVLYYLLRDDPEGELAAEDNEKDMVKKSKDLTKTEVLQILQDISSMQSTMKANMKVLTKDLVENTLSFDEIYSRVKEAQPEDPVQKHGISAEDLDRTLQNSSSDPEVMLAVSKIMGPPEPAGKNSMTDRGKELSVGDIVDIHAYMLQELREFAKTFEENPTKAKLDPKIVGMASQAVLDAKVAAKFNVSSEDMEGAIVLNKTKLLQDMRFMKMHMEMQQVMQQFMGAPF